ncbi:Ceramide synthase 4 [Willisornis vidua]|uniref:Ceramide synthase 4 n=1 Tax=Willisornis vidua TaxID=1566151 RepID=A0ABQ9DHD1_9PASS|nr:Ceramide synthase 4 [Willisornis vidua]
MARSLYEWLWQHEFWLPPGITWEDMQESEDIHYPQPRDLLLSIPFALILVVIRCAFERAIALPLSTKLGVRDKQRPKPQPNPVLETFYSMCRKNPEESSFVEVVFVLELLEVSLTGGVSLKVQLCVGGDSVFVKGLMPEVIDEEIDMEQFRVWRSMFYIISFFTGLAVLYDKPWLWDHRECWTGYPQQPLQPSLFWYYMLELSFYWSLVFTLPFDVKRKDFKEQIVHHAATIFLISFSYCANYIRIGTLVLVIHDASDCILEPTKIFNYMKWKKTCDSLFMIFSAVFLISRLVIYPYTVLYNTYYYSMEIFQPFFGYYFVNTLLIILQLLHVFWSCLIIHMVYKFILHGTMEKDMRSDTEESDKDEERDKIREKEKNGITYFSNITSNGYIQRNGSESLKSRALTNGHVKER